MIYQTIGERIQQAREERGLTQEELAAKLGCTQSALSNYELGKRRIYLAGLEQIAQMLGKPLSYFTEVPSSGPAQQNVARLLEEPQLKEILLAAAELPPEERKLALDFIKWRREKR
jgi:transcriptional regulator with XRE-family HTH domain